MNQIVAKPAHWPTLFEAVETRGLAFQSQGAAAAPLPPAPASASANAGVFDETLYNELESALGPDLMRASVATFRAGIGEYIEKLDATLAAGDKSAAHRIGHAIKGTCAQFGATEVSRLGAAIEAKTCTLEDMKQHAGAIRPAFARFNLVLDARMASPQAPSIVQKS